ncbi:ogr/Delta-like zinc finger family protein [Serratia sp. JUb9]|uniref:ogr/Delta-like zinc finger family protein n=1 Tax=Serratia sp. JUb9 TaxID=2724469 RepID=UPI00164E08E4|nr:ogr/Delta-like zinc finger family protein [Serratia sp. JUb9]QNK31704.1 ogr/Delta-like zinc finger family protein [Serratia sp. JUb9]
MMHCPVCGNVAHTRSSRYLSESTKERYHQCQNINCSCTFATHESVARVIVKRGDNPQVPAGVATGKARPAAQTAAKR